MASVKRAFLVVVSTYRMFFSENKEIPSIHYMKMYLRHWFFLKKVFLNYVRDHSVHGDMLDSSHLCFIELFNCLEADMGLVQPWAPLSFNLVAIQQRQVWARNKSHVVQRLFL